MAQTKLTKLELQIMESVWSKGPLSIREIQDEFPRKKKPAYTTVQTTVYRLEAKAALRRAKKIGNAHIFEPIISRSVAQRQFFDDLLAPFLGRTEPFMSYLIETGKLTLADVEEAERRLREIVKKKGATSGT